MAAPLDVFEGTEEFLRELIEQHRFKVERVRDVDGELVDGDWFVPCRLACILYQYDADTWAANLLSTRWHNRLVRRFGSAVTLFGEPAELAKGCGPGDEHTLHFPSELILPVARMLKVRRRRRVSDEQRRAAAERMRAYWSAKRIAVG